MMRRIAAHLTRAARRGPSRRGSVRAIAIAGLVSAAVVAQGAITPTNASWTDTEWAHDSGVGTVNCADPADGTFATRGEGRALSGALLGIDLDTVAEARGVEMTNDAARSIETHRTIVDPPDDAYANPLDVGVLNGEQTSLVDLTFGDLLKLPLDTTTGAVGQYAQAESDGASRGAGGYVSDQGGVFLDEPATGYPELATLNLTELLNGLDGLGLVPDLNVGDLLADVADASLSTGAVAGRAEVDGCDLAWAGSPGTAAYSAALAEDLTRDYVAAAVDLDVETPLVGDLVTNVAGVVDGLESTVNGISGNEGFLTDLTGGLTGLLNPLLTNPILELGEIEISSVSAEIDLSAVRSLLTDEVSDSGGVLTVDIGQGLVHVDTAALLAAAYPGEYSAGLNGLPPNTNLLADPAILTTLVSALTGALEAWIADVNAALASALDLLTVDIGLEINLEVEAVLVVLPVWVPIGHIAVDVTGTLADLTTAAEIELLPGLGPIVSGLINGILAPVLNGLVSGLVSGAGGVVEAALRGTLDTLAVVPATVEALVTPIVELVSALYTALFLDGVVAVTVNAQNDPASGLPEPADWASLEPGRYDVAALRIGVLDGLLGENSVHLYLGRGSVGPGCTLASAPAGCPGY